MRIFYQFFKFIFCALFFALLVFVVPIYAEDEVYVGTLGPGQSISTKGISYAIYKITATNIPSYDSWCPGCFNGGSNLSTAGADTVYSTYSVYVDGFRVFDYCSTSGGEGKIDLSQYSDSDAVLSLPNNYSVSQTIRCHGCREHESCGYSSNRNITVSGSLQLYSYSKKPKLISNPVGTSSDTDKSATFSVEGERTAMYRWQINDGRGYSDLSDGTGIGGVVYSGTHTDTLHVSNVRYALNGVLFRCVLVGENGDEVYSEPASISVADVTEPSVSLSYSPTDNTYDKVTIIISASDPDSGLIDKPYYYIGGYHSENSFTVTSNGTYEVEVRDSVGNVSKKSINISNIVPKPTPTPTPTPSSSSSSLSGTSNSTGSSTQIVPATQNVPINTVYAVPKNTSTKYNSDTGTKKNNTNEKKQDDSDKEKKTDTDIEKKVNVNNFSNSYKSKAEKKAQDKDYNLDLDMNTDKTDENTVSETVDNDIMNSSAPSENGESGKIESVNYGSVIALSVGVLILLLAVIVAMILPVRVESVDELGTWHFCSLKMMSFKMGYILNLGLLLEDFDSLRLHFGALFMLLAKGKELTIMLDGSETIILSEITQNVIIEYSQVRRNQI